MDVTTILAPGGIAGAIAFGARMLWAEYIKRSDAEHAERARDRAALIDTLKAQVAELSRGLAAAEQYITQLLTAWHIMLPHKDPPKPPPGLRMTTTKED